MDKKDFFFLKIAAIIGLSFHTKLVTPTVLRSEHSLSNDVYLYNMIYNISVDLDFWSGLNFIYTDG